MLSDVEANGMRVDVGRIDQTIADTTEYIDRLTEELKKDDLWKTWRRRFGERASLGSRSQLGKVLEEMGLKPKGEVKHGKRESMDKDALDGVDYPFVKTYLDLERKKKLSGTYLLGLKREVVDGYVHPVFNLHLVRTHRSSASTPNVQNQLVRDAEAAKLLRSCYIPRDGCVLTECDYGALEFKGSACLWAESGLIEYATDTTKDIHRDVAKNCYLLPVDQVSKNSRYCGKNKFVFPRLYGSDYVACARSLWNAIDAMKLAFKDGSIGLKEHLASKGITELGRLDRKLQPVQGTFEWHIKRVQDRWDSWFPGLEQKKEEWVREYEKRGYFDLMTGFRCSGIYSLNDLYNYPVQGPCFHLLLWSMTRLHRELKKRKMRSLIVGEIHDSIIADVPKEEVEDYFALAKQIMTEDVRKHYSWVIVPLLAEPEVCWPSWSEKVAWNHGMTI